MPTSLTNGKAGAQRLFINKHSLQYANFFSTHLEVTYKKECSDTELLAMHPLNTFASNKTTGMTNDAFEKTTSFLFFNNLPVPWLRQHFPWLVHKQPGRQGARLCTVLAKVWGFEVWSYCSKDFFVAEFYYIADWMTRQKTKERLMKLIKSLRNSVHFCQTKLWYTVGSVRMFENGQKKNPVTKTGHTYKKCCLWL